MTTSDIESGRLWSEIMEEEFEDVPEGIIIYPYTGGETISTLDNFTITSGNRLWSEMVNEEFGEPPNGIIYYPYVDEYGQTYEGPEDPVDSGAEGTEENNSTVPEPEKTQGGYEERGEESSVNIQSPEKDQSTGKTPLTVAEAETASDTLLQSDVVKKVIEYKPNWEILPQREGGYKERLRKRTSLEDVKTENGESQGSPSSLTAELEVVQVENTNSSASVTPHSGYIKKEDSHHQDLTTSTCNDVTTERDRSQAFAPNKLPKVKQLRKPCRFNYRHKQMNPRNQQLEIMRNTLQEKNLLL